MTYKEFYVNFPDLFKEGLSNVNWKAVSSRLDDGDAVEIWHMIHLAIDIVKENLEEELEVRPEMKRGFQ